ncbi:hypothetical protein CGZ80_05470 [Rhodopirellula sp. MGV]|nr:hypothetical protein CGZ80_05470 [Rhodopirellula sp. MGV]PNY36414.1 O-antigen ligase domain-containing protein [Rhodopirellula baltica]
MSYLSQSRVRSRSQTIVAIASFLLAMVPAAVAIDFGGALNWSQYVGSVVAASIASVLFIAVSVHGLPRFRVPVVFLVFALWNAYAWVQGTSFPVSIAERLSPGVANEFLDSLAPIEKGVAHAGLFVDQLPLSVDADSTFHAAALWSVAIVIAGVFLACSRMPSVVPAVLLSLSLSVSIVDFVSLLDSAFSISGWAREGSLGFGPFVNRHHAGLFTLFGLAATLGVAHWRYAKVNHRGEFSSGFSFEGLAESFRDSLFSYSIAAIVLQASALLACGSLVAVVGLVGSLLFVVNRGRYRKLIALVVVVGGLSVAIIGSIYASESSRQQAFSLVFRGAVVEDASQAEDQRWDHWYDAMRSAKAYLPFGAGTGAYAYAYLPYQSRSAEAWFHHADNLWIETIVDQGVIGGIFLVIAIVVVFLQLDRLNTEEAIAKGGKTAGLFAFGATVWTQTFDYGLVLFANLFAFSVLMSAVLSKSNFGFEADGSRSVRFSRMGCKVLAVVFLLVAIGASLNVLRDDAIVESEVRSAEALIGQAATDFAVLDRRIERIEQILTKDDSPALHRVACSLLQQRARFSEIEYLNPTNAEEAEQAISLTSKTGRRLRPLADASSAPKPSYQEFYRRAYAHAVQGAVDLPLDPDLLSKLVYLDFVEPDQVDSLALVSRLFQLQKRFPRQLLRLGQLAEQSVGIDSEQIAIKCYYMASLLQPPSVAEAIRFAARHPGVAVSEVVPANSLHLQYAVRFLLKTPVIRTQLGVSADDFFRMVAAELDCSSADSLLQQSACWRLRAKVLFELGETAEGLKSLMVARELSPVDASIYLEQIDEMVKAGMYLEATQVTTLALQVFPEDSRFEAWRHRLAAMSPLK